MIESPTAPEALLKFLQKFSERENALKLLRAAFPDRRLAENFAVMVFRLFEDFGRGLQCR